jgi:hypothetical protein
MDNSAFTAKTAKVFLSRNISEPFIINELSDCIDFKSTNQLNNFDKHKVINSNKRLKLKNIFKDDKFTSKTNESTSTVFSSVDIQSGDFYDFNEEYNGNLVDNTQISQPDQSSSTTLQHIKKSNNVI